MNRGIVTAALGTLLVGWCSFAVANPVMWNMSSAMQTPESMHVQVSYFVGGSWDVGWRPVQAERNGEALEIVWVEGSVEFNGGSGIRGYEALQFCDCDLESGAYEYKVILESGAEGYPSPRLKVEGGDPTVHVTDPPPPQQEREPMPEGDVEPWNIPDGPWPIGLDCIQWCQEHPAGSAAAAGSRASEDGGSSACAAGPPSSPNMALGLLALAALLLLALCNRFLRTGG